jgi:signal transduction histidine kinase
MIQPLVFVAFGVALILFVAFVAARLLRSRTAGMSIRMQIFIALAAIVGAFALGLGLLVIDRVKARATTLAEESARSEASAVAALVGNEIEVKGRTLEEVGRDLAGAQGGMQIALLAPDGHEVYARSASIDTPGTVSAVAPIRAAGREVGSVRVVKPTIVIQRMLADFAPTILVLSVVLGGAAAVSAALIGRQIASPIETLTEFAVRVSEGERRAAPPPTTGREVQRLSRALDSMRRELEGRPFVEAFAADLSHELKNPVAAIRASAEVLADGALDEPEEAARFVGRIQQATTRIEALLGELLSLARIEARGVEESGEVDLAAIAREVAGRATEDGATVEVRGTAPAVKGDRLWLGRLVENLVDNARTHGTPGAKVTIEVSRQGDDVVLAVTNEGAVGAHLQKRIFRRFVTTRPDRGGTGLGLAIVRAVAEAHGGSAECASFGPPEVRFRVRLPTA